MLRKTLLSILIMLFAISVSAAGLRVGVSPDYPPLIYKQEGRLVGFEADNAKAIGDILDQKMQLIEMPFEQLIPALQAGQIDIIMTGMSITPDRSEQVIFTDPYLDVGQMAIISTDRVGQFSKPWSLYQKGVRIGVEPGTTGAQFVADKAAEAQVVFYADPSSAFTGLRKHEIDFYIHDAPTSWLLATDPGNGDLISLYNPLTEEQLAWAVGKDDARLAQSLNAALRTLRANGTLGYIRNRWIPVTVEVR